METNSKRKFRDKVLTGLRFGGAEANCACADALRRRRPERIPACRLVNNDRTARNAARNGNWRAHQRYPNCFYEIGIMFRRENPRTRSDSPDSRTPRDIHSPSCLVIVLRKQIDQFRSSGLENRGREMEFIFAAQRGIVSLAAPDSISRLSRFASRRLARRDRVIPYAV